MHNFSYPNTYQGPLLKMLFCVLSFICIYYTFIFKRGVGIDDPLPLQFTVQSCDNRNLARRSRITLLFTADLEIL